jgi:hypothetical protein
VGRVRGGGREVYRCKQSRAARRDAHAVHLDGVAVRRLVALLAVDDQRPLHGQPGRQVREARRHLGKPRALATSDRRGSESNDNRTGPAEPQLTTDPRAQRRGGAASLRAWVHVLGCARSPDRRAKGAASASAPRPWPSALPSGVRSPRTYRRGRERESPRDRRSVRCDPTRIHARGSCHKSNRVWSSAATGTVFPETQAVHEVTFPHAGLGDLQLSRMPETSRVPPSCSHRCCRR